MSSSSVPEPRLTARDYMALDDEQRCELIEGRLIMMAPAPNLKHQRVATRLTTLLESHVEAHALGYVFAAPLDVALFDDTVVQPDVLFVAAERFAALFDGHGLSGAPDLVIEVLSPGTSRLDRSTKRDLYLRAGVAWLILVEPDDELVEVFRRGADGAHYVLENTVSGSDTLEVALLPGLAIELGTVWFDPARFVDR